MVMSAFPTQECLLQIFLLTRNVTWFFFQIGKGRKIHTIFAWNRKVTFGNFAKSDFRFKWEVWQPCNDTLVNLPSFTLYSQGTCALSFSGCTQPFTQSERSYGGIALLHEDNITRLVVSSNDHVGKSAILHVISPLSFNGCTYAFSLSISNEALS
jgi:hypothetical protein